MSPVSAAHFVFVHGACHGAWCWYKMRTLLESAGHTVTCLDLAGAGIDPSDPDKISTFDEYNQPLADFMAALPEHQKVILVGHSVGGFNVTRAINDFGDKIHLAVYVAAAMLRTNTGPPPQFPADDVIYNFGKGPNNMPTSVIFKQESLRKLLYNRSPHEDSTLASMLIRPAPIVFLTAGFTPGKYIDKVRRVFVKTTDDDQMALSDQEAYIKEWPPAQTFEVDSDHSAFFSAPTQLFSVLIEAISKHYN